VSPIRSQRPSFIGLNSFRIIVLPFLEAEAEGVLRKRQVADGDLVELVLHRQYIEILQQRGYCREAEILDHLVAHAGTPTAAEWQEVLWLQESAVLHESLRHKLLRGGPQLLRHVQIVIVQEDECVLLDFVA